MSQKFTNGAKAALTGSINAAATALAVSNALADLFPVGNTTTWVTPLNWFKCILADNTGQVEVIKVGVRASGSGAFTNVLRGQDGTTAKAFTAGSTYVVHGPVAADFEAILAGIFTDLQAATLDLSGNLKRGGAVVRPVPVGGIIMWSGAVAALPTGWGLCDGNNGTPDLRDKFVIGAGTDLTAVSQTNVTGAQTKSGGSKDLIVPTHNHTASFTGAALAAHGHTINDPTHVHGNGGYAVTGGAGYPGLDGSGDAAAPSNTSAALTGISINTASAGTPAGTVAVAATGASATNANLPPYYALAFIMCLATP